MKLLLLLLAGLLCTVQVFADDLDEFNLDDLLEEDFDESAEELLRQFEQKNSVNTKTYKNIPLNS